MNGIETTKEKNPSLQTTLQGLAEKYRCDPRDPIFSVLEKMDEYHTDAKQGFMATLPREMEVLNHLIQTFQTKASELNQSAVMLGASGNVFEKNAQMIAESTNGLTRYWKQIHWYHALLGMGVTLLLCSVAFGVFYAKSADRVLSQVGVTLRSEPGPKGKRLVLSGKKLIDAAQSSSNVVLEYAL